MSDETPRPSAEPALALADRLALRPKQAASALSLSEAAFRRVAPEIPCVRRGKIKLYRPETLDAWLRKNERSDAETAEAIADQLLADI